MKFEFWEDWVPPLKHIFIVFFTLFVIAISYTIISSLIGYNLVIDWEIVGQRIPIQVNIKNLEFGNFVVPLQAENFVINQWYQGGDIQVNLFAFYFFFIVTIMALVLGLTSATFLSKIWYYGLVLMFIAVLVFFKFDSILLFGLSDNTTLILVIVSYLGLSYFFYTIKPGFDFIQRLKLFGSLTIFWGLIIFFFAEVDRPFMMLGSNGFLIPFLIGVIFIFSVSHEIIHFIVVALTRSSVESRNNLTHFTVFSIIYLANVLILFLHDTHVIDWNFYYLNPYLLLGVSALLGLWGLQSRMTLFDIDSKLYPLVVFIYLSAGLCAFGTTLYFVGNMNDSILQVVKDAIIYSHLGFGFIFFIYVISNFMGMLRSKMKVYQVIYKARNMPHFIFRFAGLILVTAFFLKENIETSVYHTISGMFNNQGDYYKVNGEKLNTETYYENGALYGYMNHKSNYSMGKISESNNNEADAITFYGNSIKVRPSQMGYVNLSNLYMGLGDFFKSIFTLDDGLKIFPSGKAILNNKGLLFSKTSMADSALIYYDASARAGDKKKVSVVNYLALLSKYNYSFDPDSILDHYGGTELAATRANAFVLKNQKNDNSEMPFLQISDSVLNIYTASLISNYLINQYKYYDTLFIADQLAIANMTANNRYQESIIYSLAISSYQRGFVDEAIRMLRWISSNSGKSDRYNHIIGLIFMDQGYFEGAIDYFDLASAAGNTKSRIASQIAQIELGSYNIDSVRSYASDILGKDSLEIDIWIELMQESVEGLSRYKDRDKILYLHFKSGSLSTAEIFKILDSIEDPELNAIAQLELFHKYLKRGEFDLTLRLIENLEDISIEETSIKQQVTEARMEAFAQRRDIDGLRELIELSGWLSFDKKWYYMGLIAQSDEDFVKADDCFRAVSGMNSFNEEAILAAAEFYMNDAEELKTYNILVNALLQNPNSIKLLKAYIRECRKQSLISYEKQATSDLARLIDSGELDQFLNSLPKREEP